MSMWYNYLTLCFNVPHWRAGEQHTGKVVIAFRDVHALFCAVSVGNSVRELLQPCLIALGSSRVLVVFRGVVALKVYGDLVVSRPS